VAVLAVWEPILPTDWSSPGTTVLKRLHDHRVRQFWDPNHLIAAAIKKVEASGALHPECCERKGFLWDLTAAYGPGVRWGDALPEPILLNGPVVNTVIDLEAVVAKAPSARARRRAGTWPAD
jgi:hypothetical protein